LKFQAVAEKTTKDSRGLLYFAAPGIIEIIVSYKIEKKIQISNGVKTTIRSTLNS